MDAKHANRFGNLAGPTLLKDVPSPLYQILSVTHIYTCIYIYRYLICINIHILCICCVLLLSGQGQLLTCQDEGQEHLRKLCGPGCLGLEDECFLWLEYHIFKAVWVNSRGVNIVNEYPSVS